jgi:hypothetical protein
VLSDVDVKFSKFVDKECDVINGEVKKWFKKLAVCRKRIVPNLCCGADVFSPSISYRKKRRLTMIG